MNFLFKRAITVALLSTVMVLSGCVQIRNAWDAITSSRVSPTLVIVSSNSFDALEITATGYLKLPRCTGQNGPACRSPKATAQLVPAIRAGRIARNNLENFLQTHPGQLATQGLYDALATATHTLHDIITQYNIGAVR